MVAHAFNLSTQEVDTEQGYRKGEASLSYIPGQDSGVVALQAMGTIKTSSEAGSVKAETVSEPENNTPQAPGRERHRGKTAGTYTQSKNDTQPLSKIQ